MAKASDSVAEPEPDAGTDAPEPDTEASWQRFRDESKTVWKEAFNEWVDEQDKAVGGANTNEGAGAGGTGTGAAGDNRRGPLNLGEGAGTAAPSRGAAPPSADKKSGGFLTDLGIVVFGKPKPKRA